MNILKRIRKSYITKGLAVLLAFNLLGELVWPTAALALTSGPAQPESMSFEPVETTDMVNLFTGDFTYNIPLMNVPGPNGGYPINLAYHASPTMDQEASWVGLGWNINAGSINRMVRGLPDDFNGDPVIENTSIKDNWTVGTNVNPGYELFGGDFSLAISGGMSYRYNSYRGFGYTLDNSAGMFNSSPAWNVGLSIDSEDGVGMTSRIGLQNEVKSGGRTYRVTNYVGIGFNSERGLNYSTGRSVSRTSMDMTMWRYKNGMVAPAGTYNDVPEEAYSQAQLDPSISSKISNKSVSSSSSATYAESSYSPSSPLPMNSFRTSISLGFGPSTVGSKYKTTYGGYYDIQRLKNKGKDVVNRAYGYEYMHDNPNEKYAQMDFSRSNDGDVRHTMSNLAMPQITHDLYGIQGQGIGGSFRPYRDEVGRVYDPNVISAIGGGYFNMEYGKDETGWGTGATVGFSEQQAWKVKNDETDKAFSKPELLWQDDAFIDLINYLNTNYPLAEDFGDAMKYLWDNNLKQAYFYLSGLGHIPTGLTGEAVKKREDFIYKIHGDKATLKTNELNFIGGEEPITGEITNLGWLPNYGLQLPSEIQNERTNADERIARNNLVHKVINQEVTDYHPDHPVLTPAMLELTTAGRDYLGEYEIFHYNWGESGPDLSEAPSVYLNRYSRGGNSIQHHNAGYKVLDNSGSYYVYALPVYNNKKVEKVFSVNAAGHAKRNDDDTEIGSSPYIYENRHSIIPFDVDNKGTVPEDDDDVEFKHANTRKFYNKRETPAYAYTYLLTSILGADYVDVNGNGPDDGDQGYWVKMDYTKYAHDYKWRAPYKGAMYSAGSTSTLEDDVASYQYGEKELWYMSRIETETHIAIFELLDGREDNYESAGELTNYYNDDDDDDEGDSGERAGLYLDKIRLYEKAVYLANPTNAVPIQTVHFDYDYSRCKNVENNRIDEGEGGKLTLTKVWFTYEGNSRGALNPYEFTYSDKNPDYGYEHYDRWGNYKGEESTLADLYSSEINQVLPYTNQYQQGAWSYDGGGVDIPLSDANQEDFQTRQDENASAWCLTEIRLPSGGVINVEYESDDYAYVQNERATQMAYITDVNEDIADKETLYRTKKDDDDNHFDVSGKSRRIFFKLEEPLSTAVYNTPELLANKVFDDYVRDLKVDESGTRNLYFKNFTTLKGVAKDFVSGYLPLEPLGQVSTRDVETGALSDVYTYGAIDPETIDGELKYTQGFVTIKPAKKKNGTLYEDFHPMALGAWQYIRTSAPQILMDMGEFDDGEIVDTKKGKAKKVKNLASFIPSITKMFTGYRRYSFNQDLARTIVPEKSMIRLTTPDKKKYGGGSRVKEIALSDNWSDFEDGESSESYGLAYDYTTREVVSGATKTISSGVAQYEPIIGGDEIALKYPKFYPGKVPFFTDNNLFFEYPVNEAYMPAPVVGYSKVTVASLNTSNQIKKAATVEGLSDPEKDRGVSGVKVYEFYTAKDYPVKFDHTNLGKSNNTLKDWRVPLIIPFVAVYRRNKIAATQGYKIELNDMHGKLKSTATYGLNKDYERLADDQYISKTTYKYRDQETSKRGGKTLLNEVPTLALNPTTREYVTDTKMVGVEYEFFTDQRHSNSEMLSTGYNGGIDIVTAGSYKIPIPSFWTTLNSSRTDVRTFVTNKIIHKSGILEEVINENESYVSSSRNLYYDHISGRPLLTVANNEFDDPVYNLSHPGYWEYDGMGHAYKNINMEFFAELERVTSASFLPVFKTTLPPEIIDDLVEGDEYIARLKVSDVTDEPYQNFKATYIARNYGSADENALFHIDKIGQSPLTIGDDIEGYFKVYRSGRRNHYMADAGSIVSMTNPIDPANVTTTTVTLDERSGSNIIPSVDAITLEVKKLTNRVLSASASVFKDNWRAETEIDYNPYQTGQAGIWRAYKNYVYAGERSQTATGGAKDPRVKDDGVMSDVPFFNWQVADVERFLPKWEWSGEITRMNKFGYETENKDRLGIYSAALYGYNHAFVIGVGGNATYGELGAHDFETNSGTFSAAEALEKEKEGNLYFHGELSETGTHDIAHLDRYKIIGGEIGAETYVLLDATYDAGYWDPISAVDLAITTSNNSGQQVRKIYRAVVTSKDGGLYGLSPYTKLGITLKEGDISETGIAYLPNTSHLGGVATVKRNVSTNSIEVTAGPSTPLSYVVAGIAHTGKKSLKLEGGTFGFNHTRLQLIPGKRYVLSYWAKRDETNVHDYDLEDKLRIYASSDVAETDLVIASETKVGRIINGWQKVEVEFELDPVAYTTTESIETEFVAGTDGLFLDDIRISPKTGGIVTHVYDPVNFRLVASLNANNYATLYFYDEQGNLYLTKQETEQGIVTVSANYGHNRLTATE